MDGKKERKRTTAIVVFFLLVVVTAVGGVYCQKENIRLSTGYQPEALRWLQQKVEAALT